MSRLNWLLVSALALSMLGVLVPRDSEAQQIHPINMVSGVDSILTGQASRVFYTVPTGQTLVLTDLTTDFLGSYASLYGNGILRFYLHRPAAYQGVFGLLALSTGLVFQGGYTLRLQLSINTPNVFRFSWSGYLVPQVVGVAPSETDQRLGFALTPNPSGQVVELRFELSKASDVSLRIYDVQGRLVTTLADARMPKGRHDFSWTGKNQQGATAASGVYFARLESSESKSVKRLVRVR